jgi:hypothetical protein
LEIWIIVVTELSIDLHRQQEDDEEINLEEEYDHNNERINDNFRGGED